MQKDSPILVVDDEPHMRKVAELSIKPLGHPVLLAADGQEAVQLARSRRPCVILLDHIMPVMDGKTALQQLKSDPETSHIPVIILSSRGQLAVGQYQGFETATMFVSKPFSPALLRREVEKLITASVSVEPQLASS
ncbi:response regulator [Prosthecobacter vanneervenii]|uniref:CheY-like chemotaxis protein n=1 Tax=Prosthecobacter vanneervenii TaxID=48466 RepID=A0A7W7Y9P3_9BACT|nr:response regulator [Prosthecobacter vanneervenii]MBB5032212.1 CheY-like chemotaxis protein [Prosthecobacter vanneervenii]